MPVEWGGYGCEGLGMGLKMGSVWLRMSSVPVRWGISEGEVCYYEHDEYVMRVY